MVNRVGAIARTELVRMFRDRSNVFFVLVFPLLLVVLIGAAFGGSVDARIGVVAPAGDPAAEGLVADLADVDGFTTVVLRDTADAEDAVARGRVSAAIVVPEGFAGALRDGRPSEVAYVGRNDASAMSIRAVVQAAVDRRAATASAARVAAEALGADPAELTDVAGVVASHVEPVEVRAEQVGGDELAREFSGLGQFDLGASSQLLLFTFLTALAGGTALIQTRQLGIARRMLATSTPSAVVLGGQAAGRIAVALLQAGYIVVASWALFRVNWGDPLASGAVIVLFCLVAGGAGMLIGATFRNDSQASGVAVGLGIGLAALGGSMMPLELFSPTMRTIAHVTPHAWANEAMAEIVRRDGGIDDVLLELGVLAAYAAGLLALATWRLRVVLTR
jgi:ABC-2 type transport system permease protein